MAVKEGFEPSMGLQTPYSLSRGAPSATRPPHRFELAYYLRTKICQMFFQEIRLIGQYITIQGTARCSSSVYEGVLVPLIGEPAACALCHPWHRLLPFVLNITALCHPWHRLIPFVLNIKAKRWASLLVIGEWALSYEFFFSA